MQFLFRSHKLREGLGSRLRLTTSSSVCRVPSYRHRIIVKKAIRQCLSSYIVQTCTLVQVIIYTVTIMATYMCSQSADYDLSKGAIIEFLWGIRSVSSMIDAVQLHVASWI